VIAAASAALYAGAILGTGVPVGWTTLTECQNVASACPLSRGKRYVLTAMVWDLFWAYSAALALWLAQRGARFSVSHTVQSANVTAGRKTLSVAVVVVIAAITGVSTKTAVGKALARNSRKRMKFQVGDVSVESNIPYSPKTRALEKLAAKRDDWNSAEAERLGSYFEKLPTAEIESRVVLFLRSRSMGNSIRGRSAGADSPIPIDQLHEKIHDILDDESVTLSERVQVLVLMMLENSGREKALQIAELGNNGPLPKS
jgi:hypothetical protein